MQSVFSERMQTVSLFVSVCSVTSGSHDLCVKPVSVCTSQLCARLLGSVCVENSGIPQRLRVHLITVC